MSVLVRYNEVGMTREKYDQVGTILEQGDFPPPGLRYHLLHGEDGSLRVSEVWDTADQFRAFNDEVLLPVLDRVGIRLSAPADVIEIHELFQF